jgi:hypothetical protein
MNNNIIIELRENDAQHKVQNGEYDILLSKQVVLEEGDTVALKSVMIDTIVQSTGQITIPDDLTLKIRFGIYLNHWIKSPNTNTTAGYIELNLAGQDMGTILGDGKLCIPYKKIPSLEAPYSYADGYGYFADNQDAPGGNIAVEYSYENINGQTIYINSYLPLIDKSTYYTDGFGQEILFRNGTFQLLTDVSSRNLQPEGLAGVIPIEEGIDHYLPYNFESDFVLPKGIYTANELSLYVSKMLSANTLSPYNTGTASDYIKTGFIKNTAMFAESMPQPDGTGGTIPENVRFVKYDPVNGMVSAIDYNNSDGSLLPPSYIIGASQIALDFDPDSNAFKFSYLHTPLLDQGTGQNLSIKYLINGGGNVSAIGAHSGIYFTYLSAFDSNNQPFDFWSGLLGFDVPSMLIGINNVVPNIFGNTNSSWAQLDMPVLGQHITSAYIGMDTAIKKSTTWYEAQSLSTSGNNYYFDATANPDQTTEIIAQNKLAELQNKFSHYLLELNMKLQNELIGADDVYRNYSGIINKYYSSGSYVYGDESGAIVYEHKGMPLVLRSVKCRILTSDKIADPLLGSDNTIYMQVIKAPQK